MVLLDFCNSRAHEPDWTRTSISPGKNNLISSMSDYTDKYGGRYPKMTFQMTDFAEHQLRELVRWFSTREGREVSRSEAVRLCISAAHAGTMGKEAPQTVRRKWDGKEIPTFGERKESKPCKRCGMRGAFCECDG